MAKHSCLRARAVPLLLVLVFPAAGAEVERTEDPETGVPVWRWQGEGASLKVAGRLPAQTRAFFLGRGFPDGAARQFAESCVLALTLRNKVRGSLRYRLADWRVRVDGEVRKIPRESAWDDLWREMGISRGARAAFDWALFPPSATFAGDDWVMGMLSVGLEPGHRFDLVARWARDGDRERAVLKGLRCPPAGAANN